MHIDSPPRQPHASAQNPAGGSMPHAAAVAHCGSGDGRRQPLRPHELSGRAASNQQG